MKTSFLEKGWALWPVDTDVQKWVKYALPVAKSRVNDPELTAEWLQCEGTWFVGVDALPNAQDGSVNGSAPLSGNGIPERQQEFDLRLQPFGIASFEEIKHPGDWQIQLSAATSTPCQSLFFPTRTIFYR